MSKIDVSPIFTGHLDTLRNFKTGKRSKSDFIIFFLLPILIAYVFYLFDLNLNILVGDLLKALAIFSAFLFNMLAIVNGALTKKNLVIGSIKEKYAKEIHANISFTIIIGLFIIILLIFQSLTVSTLDYFSFKVNTLLNLSNIFLISLFFLTLIMCLNRIYVLLRN
ncbi:membrane protease YdiL (CAAX protease family) [Lewinella antarctica]|uniref:Membrane protease YdiL (CAAX protease family) n=1 Tax=Neolewinella antarctica TaxID=442734 RepID=A0ABX0XFM9_9BACT|nr:membrane protease YdiL (CAAX protease family) [Neolewinella antarctica]